MEDYCRLIYLQVYARIQPYLLGIILGWILHKTKDKVVRLNWVRIHLDETQFLPTSQQ